MLKALFRSRVMFVLASVLVSLLVVLVVFRCSDYFEDDMYNIGVIRRSALGADGPFLSTSLVSNYFQQYRLPRPEDWHRSLSLILATIAVKWVGIYVIKALHTLYVLCLGLMVVVIVRNAVAERPLRRSGPLAGSWLGLVVAAVVAFNPAGLLLLSRSAMDDVPAACLVMAAILILLRRERPAALDLVIAGQFIGLAIWAKDLYILWGLIGPLVLLVNGFHKGGWPVRTTWARAVGLGLSAIPLLFAKLIWNRSDLGIWLPDLALTENRLIMYGMFSNISSHYPYYLFGDSRFMSTETVAGGTLPALKALVFRQLLSLRLLIVSCLPLLPPIVVALFVSRRFLSERPYFARLANAAGVSWAVYTVFFLSGAGTADQMRYWLVPVILATGLGCVFAVEKLRDTAKGMTVGRVALVATLYFLGVFQFPMAYTDLRRPPLIDEGVVAWLHDAANQPATGGAVALIGKRAMYYYAQTGDRVMTLWPPVATDLNAADRSRWLQNFGVTWALMTDQEQQTTESLKEIGFVPVKQASGVTILHRP
jgi:hypothetical protein